MSPSPTIFNTGFLPILWDSLLAMFGLSVEYYIGGDPGQSVALSIIWKEGAEDEDVSPGRYSHILIQNADLPGPPKEGDVVYSGGSLFDVVRVNVFAINYSSVVLQDRSDKF